MREKFFKFLDQKPPKGHDLNFCGAYFRGARDSLLVVVKHLEYLLFELLEYLTNVYALVSLRF